jgi:hypothetical protein
MRKERCVSDDTALAVQMWTRFVARADASDTLFGPVQAGESFDCRGVTMYEIGGQKTELGMPH